MNLAIQAAPVPLPGKVQPAPKPALGWVGVPLVSATISSTSVGATQPKVETTSYTAMGHQNVDEQGFVENGPVDVRAFEPIGSVTLREAVEAASQVASTRSINVNVVRKDQTEDRASLAVGVLQAADGAFYLTSFAGGHRQALTVDTGRANFEVLDVSALNPAVKAVVGAHSWVNFTDEDVQPTLAG